MRTLKEGKVESVTLERTISSDLDQCRIVIDFDSIVAFYPFSELSNYIGKDVRYDVRPDIVSGVPETVLSEIVLVSEIQTVDATVNKKLIPMNTKRPMCNFSIKDIKYGVPECGKIALMVSATKGASKKASWYDCTMLDMYSKQFSLRIFSTQISLGEDNSVGIESKINSYVKFDIMKTKYGFQTDELYFVSDVTEPSPEVTISREIVKNYVATDSALNEYFKAYDMASVLDSSIDGEPGYAWVKIASEFYVIDALDNISSDVDVRAMKRAAVCSYGYLLPHNDPWARNVLNVVKLLKFKELKEDAELKAMLDPAYGAPSSTTKQMYLLVRHIVSHLIKLRREDSSEETFDALIDDVKRAAYGML